VDQNLPLRAQYITAAEIAAKKARQKTQRKATRRTIKTQRSHAVAKIWPYEVKLKNSIAQQDRFAIRRWMLDQQIRRYDPEIQNHNRSDVFFDDAWKVFHFANEQHAMMFNLCFG